MVLHNTHHNAEHYFTLILVLFIYLQPVTHLLFAFNVILHMSSQERSHIIDTFICSCVNPFK